MSTPPENAQRSSQERVDTIRPEEDPQDLMPTVLSLQRLLQDRLRVRPGGGISGGFGDEVAVVSVTSCTHHSCT